MAGLEAGPFQPIPDKSDLWLDLAACEVPGRFDLEVAPVHPVGDYLIHCVFHCNSLSCRPPLQRVALVLVTLDRGWAALSAKSKLKVVAYMVSLDFVLDFLLTEMV